MSNEYPKRSKNERNVSGFKCPDCDKFHSGHESRNKQGLAKGLRIKKMR